MNTLTIQTNAQLYFDVVLLQGDLQHISAHMWPNSLRHEQVYNYKTVSTGGSGSFVIVSVHRILIFISLKKATYMAETCCTSPYYKKNIKIILRIYWY